MNTSKLETLNQDARYFNAEITKLQLEIERFEDDIDLYERMIYKLNAKIVKLKHKIDLNQRVLEDYSHDYSLAQTRISELKYK